MNNLKNENFENCLSLLKDFVNHAAASEYRKRKAILALQQLQHIVAGDNNESSLFIHDTTCNSMPMGI